MYLAMVVILMGVLPLASIAVEGLLFPGPHDYLFLLGKWVVFWAGGVRLALAGVRQILAPALTARDIFEVNDPRAFHIVTELGFGNLAIGLIAIVSVVRSDFVLPAAVAAGLFYGLAGAKHVSNGRRNQSQDVAMVSDLAVFALLAIFVVVMSFRPH